MSKSVYDGMDRLLVRYQACVPGTTGVPAGNVIETHWENDKLGRRIRLMESLEWCQLPACTSKSKQAESLLHIPRTTEFAWHPSGQLERLILHNPDTGEQVTRWIFGTTLENSAIASNRLLRAKIYPESDDRPAPLNDGPDDVYARLEYSYNKQGDPTTFKDADGTIHAYEYDKLGRQIEDRVTELAAHLNGAVRRIETSYTVRSLLHKVTSYNAASGGTVVNEVERRYDAFNNLIEDRQVHDGAVNGSTLATSAVALLYWEQAVAEAKEKCECKI